MSVQRFKRLFIYKVGDKNVGVLNFERGDKHS